MTPAELDSFTARYFADWAALQGTQAERLALEDDPITRPSCVLDEMVARRSQNSEEAWPLVLALIERAPDEAALAFVAAGPLEDLVRDHARRFADRLVEHARRTHATGTARWPTPST